jgi:histidyl-tRNA synthetase
MPDGEPSSVKREYPETRVMSGFMELLPEDQIEFDKIKRIILETYESYGFTALDTPVMERMEVLRAKSVGETENSTLLFEIKREDDRKEAGLRFDLTVPLARYVAEHFNELAFPFRRCHLAKVYRRERAQKGRFREFYQCDIDIIGHDSLSIRYDAEIPSIIFRLFRRLGFGKFTIRVNNRKLLNGLVESLGCAASPEDVLGVIDRMEKISGEEFAALLKKQGLDDGMIGTLTDFCGITGDNAEVLRRLKNMGISNENYDAGLSELATVVDFMEALGVDGDYYRISPRIVRGLDYYTGTVYETVLDDYPQVGAVCSGGRFDNLAGAYTKERLPGVGISIGLTRLFYQLREIGLIKSARKTSADVVIIPREDADIPGALAASRLLRDGGFNVDVLLETQSLKKKFNYVARKDARFTVVIGDEEGEGGSVTLQYKAADGTLVKRRVPRAGLAETIKGV